MNIKQNKRFWKLNFRIATLLFLLFLTTILLLFKNMSMDVDMIYIKILISIICLSSIQFIICLIYYFLKIKQHSIFKVLFPICIMIIIYVEICISFGILGGFLGDM